MKGDRRICPTCRQEVGPHITPDHLSCYGINGPRGISSSNVDRIFDDDGRRFLLIEEKWPDEGIPRGQGKLLLGLAKLPQWTVWLVKGTPESVAVMDIAQRRWLLEGQPFSSYENLVNDWFGK